MSRLFTGAAAVSVGCAACVFAVATVKPPVGVGRSPTHRPQQSPAPVSRPPDLQVGPAQYPSEFRRIDGWWNNPEHGEWGAARTTLLRLMEPEYGDGAGNVPGGQDRPGPRVVSNIVNSQPGDMPNDLGLTDFIWQWGQWIDHDVVETPIAQPAERFDIPVPQGDPWFDPHGTGREVIPLDRSGYRMVDGVRQQINHITSFIDGSQVYGSDKARAQELRTLDGTGRLKTSEGNFLPYNVNGFPNIPDPNDPTMFVGGDIRVNEQSALTAMHTLFVREHNYWADRIRAERPNLSGEKIYLYARAIVGAEIQAITYNEFLPAILGPNALPPYEGYRPDVNPSIANEFATAGWRMGHTLLSPVLLRLDENGHVIPEGNLPLEEAFFRPELIVELGIEPLLRGLVVRPAQTLDPYIIDPVRNMLFGPPGAGGFDLVSLNMQRGRDHGVASYNHVRRSLGLAEVQLFEEITDDPEIVRRLEEAYGHVDRIDPWVGLLSEPHVEGSIYGQCLFMLITDQFTRLRDGDRFWYESYLGPQAARFIETQTLATIIRRNTTIDREIQDDVFHLRR
ncbi:MAG: hypothetical protein IT430_03545 [Phycisphaerales bacterium]|nr:hypothetical protein [Phycisphaerales bacterium]